MDVGKTKTISIPQAIIISTGKTDDEPNEKGFEGTDRAKKTELPVQGGKIS